MEKLDPATVKMVEKAIHDAPDYPTKKGLWKSLPKKIPYRELEEIVDHLISLSKIIIDDRDGTIVWVYVDNAKLRKLMKNSVVIRRS